MKKAPTKFLVAMFISPRLDDAGNSVKAQRVIEYVAQKLDLSTSFHRDRLA